MGLIILIWIDHILISSPQKSCKSNFHTNSEIMKTIILSESLEKTSTSSRLGGEFTIHGSGGV